MLVINIQITIIEHYSMPASVLYILWISIIFTNILMKEYLYITLFKERKIFLLKLSDIRQLSLFLKDISNVTIIFSCSFTNDI